MNHYRPAEDKCLEYPAKSYSRRGGAEVGQGHKHAATYTHREAFLVSPYAPGLYAPSPYVPSPYAPGTLRTVGVRFGCAD